MEKFSAIVVTDRTCEDQPAYVYFLDAMNADHAKVVAREIHMKAHPIDNRIITIVVVYGNAMIFK